jgi:hypothetical protein
MKLTTTVALVILLFGCGGGSNGAGTGNNAGSSGTNSGNAGAVATGGDSGGAAGAAGNPGPPAPPPSSVDGTKKVADATTADLSAICDWFAGLVGGYGAPRTCSTAILTAPLSQADCVGSFPPCDVTFSDFEACVSVVTQAQATCTGSSVADAHDSDTCAPVTNAGCF